MNFTWSFYRLSDGHFVSRTLTATSRELVKRNTPEGCAAICGRFDHLSQRFDLETGAVIDDPELAQENRKHLEIERARSSALQRIAKLERRQARPLRELAIDPGNEEARQRLAAIETEIAVAREAL